MLNKIKKKILIIITDSYFGLIKILCPSKLNANLLIFDDYFPNPMSDWRYNEFVFYLNKIKDTKIVLIKNTNTTDLLKFKSNNLNLKDKVFPFKKTELYSANIAYCLFYNNLKFAFQIFEERKIPFIFTLYPGGGFKLYDKIFESELKIFFDSKYFLHVIVNMPHVYNYLIQRFNLSCNQITLIYGVPLNFNESESIVKQTTLKRNKLKIVFSAHKYSRYGLDKGLDIFVKIAKYFEGDTRFEFYLIGKYDKYDFIVPTENINMVGDLAPELMTFKLSEFDIILSPNRSNILHYGSFDGFPTGSVMHACFQDCLMMITDEYDNAKSINLIDGIDFIKIFPNVDFIIEKLIFLFNNQDLLSKISSNGKNKLLDNLDLGNQMKKRHNIFNFFLKKYHYDSSY